MSLLEFHALAQAHGDGLHPALRDLLEQRQALESDPRIAELNAVRSDGVLQAGPNPSPSGQALRLGNIIDFKARAAEAAADVVPFQNKKGST